MWGSLYVFVMVVGDIESEEFTGKKVYERFFFNIPASKEGETFTADCELQHTKKTIRRDVTLIFLSVFLWLYVQSFISKDLYRLIMVMNTRATPRPLKFPQTLPLSQASKQAHQGRRSEVQAVRQAGRQARQGKHSRLVGWSEWFDPGRERKVKSCWPSSCNGELIGQDVEVRLLVPVYILVTEAYREDTKESICIYLTSTLTGYQLSFPKVREE